MNRNFSLAALALCSLLGAACSADEPANRQTLYQGLTLIQPSQELVMEDAYIIVEDGIIADLGTGTPPRGSYADVHDMTGRFALPGFIDAHAHLTAGPHELQIDENGVLITIDSVDEVTRFGALTALAFGVTTLRNTGADPEASADYMAQRQSGAWLGPDMLYAGAVIQPPPFGGAAFAYPETEAEWQAEVARQAGLGVSYLKLYHGLTEDQLATGIRIAHEHGLEAIAHLDQVSWTRAAQLGMDGLLHALPVSADVLEPDQRAAFLAEMTPDSRYLYRWFERVDYDGPLFQELLEALVANDVSVDLTMVVNDMTYHANDMARNFPDADHAYYHPDMLAGLIEFMSLSGTGWTDDDYVRAAAAMDRVYEFARRLDAAGVRLLLGTDGAGGGPLLTREMALHIDAGFTNWRVLQMVTSSAADILGIASRTGSLQPGLEADIVFLNQNPLDDITHARDVFAVLNDGSFHRPEDLHNAAAGLLTAPSPDE